MPSEGHVLPLLITSSISAIFLLGDFIIESNWHKVSREEEEIFIFPFPLK